MGNQIIRKEISRYSIDKPSEVSKMAVVLKKHIIANNLSVKITGKDYVMVEGWQFAGGLLGLFPRIVRVENIGTMKWMAQAEIVDKSGKVVSTGYAICSKEEMKKKSFDEYAIVSMAQTRAIGKAFRNLIGWVIKMGGFESTPAEEMPKGKPIEKVSKSNATNYVEQLKVEAYKGGAKTEKEAIDYLNKKSGLKLDSLNND